LVAEVEFTGWTDERLFRQASFIALRSDKSASAVQREAAIVPTKSAVTGDAARAPVRVAGVTISHPQRPIWPAEAIDKAALARYHERVGRWLLPQLKSRPLSLVRCPDGVEASCFFQRHMGPARPQGVKTFIWQRSTAGKSYLFVDTLPAVIQLVQHGVVELHTWGATMPRPDRPDRITIDLDPDPDLPWERVAEAAQLVRALVEEVGLHAFAKTTGGKGLHIVVPLLRRQGWDEVKSFARAIAEHLVGAMPDRFTASIARQQRAGRIFVDYLRNGEAATAVAAYSVRARPGAPVSMPIRWDDLAEDVRGRFNLTNVPDLLAAQRRDPWAGYAQGARGLTRAMLRALGVAK
jgi:bifunctional non-homologous end joining protein LigD